MLVKAESKHKTCEKALPVLLEDFSETVLSEELENEIFFLSFLFWCDVSDRAGKLSTSDDRGNKNPAA